MNMTTEQMMDKCHLLISSCANACEAAGRQEKVEMLADKIRDVIEGHPISEAIAALGAALFVVFEDSRESERTMM